MHCTAITWNGSMSDYFGLAGSLKEKGDHRNMMLHVSLSFASLADGPFGNLAENVVTRMDSNPSFLTPTVPIATLTASLAVFRAAVETAAGGGKQATAAKNAARAALLDLLRQQAGYVEGVAMGDMAMLLSSGFNAASKNRAQVPLPQPVIQRIDNQASTQLRVRVGTVRNARAFEVVISIGTGPVQVAGTFTSARRIIVTGLTPGTTYTVRVRAVGGSTGYSDWSDPVSHMAM